MKILAIRGANLASLKGTFEVDLARPPLCHLGLFAIAGPVGAGKSTLLDAMCLALFNRTPRLSGRGGSPLPRDVAAGGEALKSNDPRSLVRRAVAGAFAEVDFTGVDGRVWRARWEVRRARGQAFGRLQDEKLSLVDVDTGQRVGEGKEGTLEEIEKRIGLSFDELCRSVLLAQGGFSTFLRAKPDERASLLEKITGTDLYSTLSVQAHERARDEAGALRALEDELAAAPPAPADERARLEREAEAADARRAEAQRLLTAAEERARHEERAALLAAAACEAAQVLDEARRARAASDAAPVSAGFSLADLERAWPLRPLARARDAALAGLTAAEEELARLLTEERRARVAVEGARERRSRADDAFTARARALADAEPLLARAVILDEQLARAAAPALAEAAARADDERRRAETALAAARRTGEATAAALARAEEALAREPSLAALVPVWPTVERDLRQLVKDDTDLEGAEALAATARRNRDDALAALEHLEEGAAAVRALVDDRRAHVERLLPDVPTDEVAALLATQTAARARDDELSARIARARDEHAHLARALDDAAATKAAAGDARDRAEAAHAAASRQLQRLERAAERGSLVDGEPCPLCGSAAHPAAHEPAPAPSVVDEQRRAVLALADDLRAHTERRAAASARVDELGVRVARLDADIRELEESRRTLGPVPPTPVLDEARAALRALRDAERALVDAEDGRAELEAARASAEQTLALHVHVVETRGAARAQRAASLTDILGGAHDLTSPRAALAHLAPLIDALRAHQQVAAAARVTLAEGEPRRRALEEEVAATRARAEDLAHRAVTARAEAEQLRAARAALFDGAPAAEVRALLTDALAEARAGAAEAAVALAGNDVRLQEVAARARAAERQALEARRHHDTALFTLERELVRLGLTDETAAAVAALDDDARERARAARRALEDAVARAEAVLEEREAARYAHALRAPAVVDVPGELPEELPVELLRARLTAATDAWSAARAALLHDDAARARAASLLPALEAQRAKTATWKALADVIGSADGARFRVFAQSLTLDALLVHANAQLALLAPRYRLERAPTEGEKRGRFDLELVVIDRDSGDDVRSVGSLSGGESFLVSLALALGLSSLSSARTRVESLFIDEGFSSLDPETLEAALAALEALRATGRQVGVISHVPALVERLGAQVRVVPLGGGRSRVDVTAA